MKYSEIKQKTNIFKVMFLQFMFHYNSSINPWPHTRQTNICRSGTYTYNVTPDNLIMACIHQAHTLRYTYT